MAHNAGQADLGAQAHDAHVLDWGVHPMSSTFDADLARANLMRVRADYVEAERICIQILKSYPKSAATHSLLGDIHADRGHLEQAAHWYELSLDLDPSSAADRQKLDDVKEQIAERDHISSAVQLGIPDDKAVKSVWIAAGAVCLFVVAIAMGFAIRYGNGGPRKDAPVVKTPIRANSDVIVTQPVGAYAAAVPLHTSVVPVTPIAIESDKQPSPTGSTLDEQSLEAAVVDRSPYGAQLVSLVQDPRTHVVLMTYLAGPNDEPRAIGADLAKTLFQLSSEPQFVTIRAMRSEKLVYMADVPRDRYEETLTEEWQKNNPGENAWIPYIMTNDWPSKDGNARTPTTDMAGMEPTPSKDAPTSPSSAGSSTPQTPPGKSGG